MFMFHVVYFRDLVAASTARRSGSSCSPSTDSPYLYMHIPFKL